MAVDATAVIPTLRSKGNTVYGLATELEVIVTSAQDVIDIIKNNNIEKAKQANAFMLVPLQEHVPSFVLAISPVVNGQDYLTVDTWFNNALRWCSAKRIKLSGVGADGDSKFRKYFTQRFLKFTEEQRRGNSVTIPYESFDFVSVIEEYDQVRRPTVMFPDWRHLIKKWRQAATRILSTSVQQCSATWKYQRTITTQTYLKIGQNMLSAFTEPNISITERAQFAWSAESFLRVWKVWINISGYKTETSFISAQTYRDFILAGHSLILSMKIYSISFPDTPYRPWMFGSNECEDLFAGLRGFCKGRSNLCMLDMIELSGRIQKLKELKIKIQSVQYPSIAPDWNNVENEIIEGMRMADKQVLKTIEFLGMLPNLQQGYVIRKEGDNLVY